MCYKKTALITAYENGLRRCPCCNVQLVWKSNATNVQKNLATVDHIVPRSIGGSNSVENMFVMCRNCNCIRGDICFVKFVTDRGYSKLEAEAIYKKAHIGTVRGIIQFMMNNVANTNDRKRSKKNMIAVVKNYRKYFNDYLPEFDLLPREILLK